MFKNSRTHLWCSISACLLWAAMAIGCGGTQTTRGALDPDQAAQVAISEYDSNGDGSIGKSELDLCPGLLSAIDRVDKNSDGVVSKAEIASRVQAYENMSDFIAAGIRVQHNKNVVGDAKVTFTPESFMGSGMPTYTGTTRKSGTTYLQTSPPTPGIMVGFYKVTITTPDGQEHTQGIEIADDVRRTASIPLEI